MNVPYAFLADYAMAHPDGKIYVVGGGLDTLFAASVPVIHPQMSLVAKIAFRPAECGRQHVIEIHALDNDGTAFLPVANMQIVPQRNEQAPTFPTTFQFVWNIQSLSLPAEGEYAFSILVDSQEVASVPLRVALIAQPPSA
jgi:hypothetical protein